MQVKDEFVDLCKNGKLNEARQLFLSNNIDIFGQYRYNCIFREFCCDQYIDIAKWLLLINNKPFSSRILTADLLYEADATIRDYLQLMFRESCQSGETETAKWLISINADKSALHSLGVIDIHADRDIAFDLSCLARHIEIIKFLLSIDNKYNYARRRISRRKRGDGDGDEVMKLLFDHNHQPCGTYDFINLDDQFVEKYRKMKESMMTALTDHLISDIADLVYYYV
jgi:hypothetical protein